MHITSSTQFKKIPWKNGLGVTTELAINEQGTVSDFAWRLSIASVVENGAFSNFQGYDRKLVLLQGNGMILHHNAEHLNRLTKPLALAQFDGGQNTVAELISGEIKDFNVMVKQTQYHSTVSCYVTNTHVSLPSSELCFIYSHECAINIINLLGYKQVENIQLPAQHLASFEHIADGQYQLQGSKFIVVTLGAVDLSR